MGSLGGGSNCVALRKEDR